MDSRGAVISARSRQRFRSPTRRPREISLGAAADEWKSCSQYIMIDTDGSSLAMFSPSIRRKRCGGEAAGGGHCGPGT
jgi:hypothetical protein